MPKRQIPSSASEAKYTVYHSQLHSRLGNDRVKVKIHMAGSSSTLGMLVVNFGTLCHRTRMILYADDGLASLFKDQIGRCDFWASLQNSNPAPSSS